MEHAFGMTWTDVQKLVVPSAQRGFVSADTLGIVVPGAPMIPAHSSGLIGLVCASFGIFTVCVVFFGYHYYATANNISHASAPPDTPLPDTPLPDTPSHTHTHAPPPTTDRKTPAGKRQRTTTD